MNVLGKIHPVFYCVLFFALGVLLSQLFQRGVVIALIILLLCFFPYIKHKRLLYLFVGIFLLLGFIRVEVWNHLYGEPTRVIGEVELHGYISREPDVREYNTRLALRIDDSHEQILITVPHYPEYRYGDYLTVTGEMVSPVPFETETGRIFNYDTFLKKDKIYYLMRYPETVLVSSGTHGNVLTKSLLRFKEMLVLQIQRHLPEPHSSLLAGLLIGAKSSLGDELLEDLRTTGVIHIVVLSGFNVTIIAEAIMRVLAFLGVIGSSIAGSIAILFFTIMTGASATVVRASLMAFLVLIARATGYHSEITRALFVAGFFMVLHNPMILLYDPSFQLSFLATLGLIIVVPWIEKKITWVPKTVFDFRGLAAASLGTQLFVLPMLMWMTGEVSIVSPLVNILVLWVVPFTMLVGFVMILVSVVSSYIALPFTAIAWFLLGYILSVVEWFSNLPFASVQISQISIVAMLLIYGIFFLVWVYNKRYGKRNKNKPES